VFCLSSGKTTIISDQVSVGAMTDSTTDRYSAGEQGLGYIYQARLALLHLLQMPEDTAVFLEKDDDLDFIDGDGGKSLASLHMCSGFC
jgi:hypothetical protein